jgi:dTDP-4-amino-4,6-dideoxygalactose transaminase
VAYAEIFAGVSLPLTEALASEVLSLPISPVMSDDEVDVVIAGVNSWT